MCPVLNFLIFFYWSVLNLDPVENIVTGPLSLSLSPVQNSMLASISIFDIRAQLLSLGSSLTVTIITSFSEPAAHLRIIEVDFGE